MGVYRLPIEPPPQPPPKTYAPCGFGGDYNWLCHKPLPSIDAYKTSSGVGLYQIQPVSERYDRVRRPLPCHLATRDPAVAWDQHLTTTALAHDRKEPTKDPATFAGNYVSAGRMTLARKFDEHIKHRPHNSNVDTCPAASVTNSTYLRHDVIPSWGKVVDLTPHVECQVRSDGLQVQPFVPPEDGGHVRLLDPMVSTTAMDFHPHTERQQSDQVGKKNIITYWDGEGYPRARTWGYGPQGSERITSLLSTRSDPDPVYDKEQFAHRAVYRRLPTRVPAVPHKGLQSEQQAAYRLPLDDFVSHRWGTGGVEYPLALYANTLSELLAAPAMYCPESAHYGSGLPVKALVDTGPAYHGGPPVHRPCPPTLCTAFRRPYAK
ncbi:uncharacterized protein LOC113208373 [Frankliniella occidentalis]|uniref:Uncharacterized protein LOC113208373 n=1 Tax=Frankliniella occidentalis TaxID=133901 RepID=A0A6J1SIQ7_FRAOC|nr:uncharacterized protein LOC113208373 [Frankliniella occidentalis]